MLIHDKAHELARSLKSSADYKALIEAQEKLSGDAKALQMFRDYRKRELSLQAAVMSGQKPNEDELASLKKLAEIVNINTLVRDYLQAEARFSVIFGDVQRILSDALSAVSALYGDETGEGGSE